MAKSSMWKIGASICQMDVQPHSLPQGNLSQLLGRRGEELSENQHLIGDGLSDWMTEKVDFSSYLSPPSQSSSPSDHSSLPPSPPQHELPVPSDLEVMTSLLQEELAQLEDYFLSESDKVDKLEKADKSVLQSTPQLYCQLPYTSYHSGHAETSPLLVTLSTGELDLLSFCGGPVGRTKAPRPSPYSCSCATNIHDRKRSLSDARLDEDLETVSWSIKRNVAVGADASVDYYSFSGDDNKSLGGEFCIGNKQALLKDDGNCYKEAVSGVGKTIDYYLVSALGSEEIESVNSNEVIEIVALNSISREKEKELSFFNASQARETYNYLESANEATSVENYKSEKSRGSYYYTSYSKQHGSDCVLDAEVRAGECSSLRKERASDGDRVTQEADFSHGVQKEVPVSTAASGAKFGERKQKKRDQNKTAAHRYRQRKRAELDSLEDELRGLEGKNRELRDKADSVEREIQYVKDLLIEVYKARSQRIKHETNA
ncbi:uncharacterized protein atf5b [Erpetoichthys calabaricus]|uniref:uncharacterized protein atf5b n=1 Tax=Erpetoichthys calabaricus TaxID=27687 RepID=UPI00223406E0|nr:uncharacterized protein atf5b [Erpetoichthys calabaricus]